MNEQLTRALREAATLMRLQAEDFEKLAERHESGELSDGDTVKESADVIMQTTTALAQALSPIS